ncbi:MAG: hypothetical protein ABF629_10535 [Sporolactobacillus sp.]
MDNDRAAEQKRIVSLGGSPFVLSESTAENRDVLTSLQKDTQGRTITLSFTRDEGVDKRTEQRVSQLVRSTLIGKFISK